MIIKRNIQIKRTIGFFIRQKYLYAVLIIGVLLCSVTNGQNSPEGADTLGYVTGIVRDAKTKEPIAAAQVSALNHIAAATTDTNGVFKIEVISATEVLLVKAYDYNPREISLRGKQSIEIDLYPEAFKDIYPVAEGLTGPVRSSLLTSAVNWTNKLGNPVVISVDDVLQYRMGGDVHAIARSGVNGLGSSLFIRGLNSVNLNAQPLFVVDGIIWNSLFDFTSLHDGYISNTLADIDLNDIESVTVIKDGTSLYGSKGGNGVVIIKTKRGKDMATRIVVNAVGGIMEKPGSLPVMDGDQFRIYATELLGTTGVSKEQIDAMYFLQDDPENIHYIKYHNSTNWDDEVYRQGTFQSYNISVNGGDERALYALSMGYTGNSGVVKNTDMQRLNTRFNADFFLSDKINMGLNVGFTNIDRNLLDDGVNFYTSPTYLAMIKSEFLNPYSYTSSGTLTTDPEDSDDFDVSNPTAIIKNALNTNKHYRLNLGIKPIFIISPALSLSDHAEYILYKVKETYYSPIIGVADQYIMGYGISQNTFKSQQMRNNGLFNDARVQYVRQFGFNHHVNAVIGTRYTLDYYESDYAEGHNSGSDEKRNLLNEEEFKYATGENNEIKSLSNYANLEYSYDNRYILNAVVSVDGSSRFGSETIGGFQMFNHSWGIFPSANAAWLISSEKFMAGAAFIDRLKIRAGYGLSGNDAIDPYAWTAYFTSVHFIDRANGLILANIGNNVIQWETSAKMEIGVDANLFNDHLALSADLYNNHTKDLLTLKSLPDLAGSGYYWNNGGELSNTGYEISANIKILNLTILKWEMGTSIGHYKNKIESLPEGDFETSIYDADILTSVGNPASVFYGYKTSGVFATEADAEAANLKIIDKYGVEHYFGAGDIHFVDQVADGIIDENDRQIIGDPNPDIYGSFNNKNMIWNFTIDAFFTFSYGNDVYNYLRSELESGGSDPYIINQTTAVLNRWRYEGQVTDQPKAVYGDPMGNSRFSDRWIEDGSYLRLKSLSINYQVPLKKRMIQGVNIWVSGNNLWTLTNYLGRDPEVSPNNAVLYQGIDTGLIPVCRSYFLGIKLNL
ncbi:MAG: SusC/RagA family TonB-linked outer membrane protein [Bacteroidales bacterium]|nr:SusC/RagA family TonB-linked outer membrane protein [Bacteroidales bacterium]